MKTEMTFCIDVKCPSGKDCLRRQFNKHVAPDVHISYSDFQREEGKDKCESGFIPKP